MLVTVLTPTYNRAHLIGTLYESLCRQSFRDFEWLIVDDGSTDYTETVISQFKAEGRISIRYIWQENGGKHRAINRGVREAAGELFFTVDSDDYLADNALEHIRHYYRTIEGDASFAGVCGPKHHFDGQRIGGAIPYDTLDCSSLEFRYKHKIKGDMAEVFRTEVLKQYPFPDYPGEKFCTEAVVYFKISETYRLRHFFKPIYFAEYRPDGLTASVRRIHRQSPYGSMYYCLQLIGYPEVTILGKIKAAINYWRYSAGQRNPPSELRPHVWMYLFYPVGLLLSRIDIYKEHKH